MTNNDLWKLKHDAQNGDLTAMATLGEMYLSGTNVTRNYPEAEEWLSKAADNGHVPSMFNLAQMHYKAQVRKPNAKVAFNLCLKAAEQGLLFAYSNVAYSYEVGVGVRKDINKAIFWYKKAAAENWPHALFSLGIIYGEGRDVPQDLKRAYYYYKRAAAVGHAFGTTNLAKCYYMGHGIKKNVPKSREIYRKASKLGDFVATFSEGLTYLNPGDNEEPDIFKAYTLMYEAKLAGYAAAAVVLDSFQHLLYPDEQKQCEDAAIKEFSRKKGRLDESNKDAIEKATGTPAFSLFNSIPVDVVFAEDGSDVGIVVAYDETSKRGTIQSITMGTVYDFNMGASNVTIVPELGDRLYFVQQMADLATGTIEARITGIENVT